MIQDIEELRPELDRHRFRHLDILQHPEIPIQVVGTDRDVPPGGAKLSRIKDGIQLLECTGIEPGIDRVQAIVRIAYQVRTLCRKTRDLRRAALGRHVIRIEHGERRAAHQRDNSAKLPSSEGLLVPLVAAHPERKVPHIAEDEAMARIEHREPALRRQVEGVLRQVVLARDRFRGRAGHVERRRVIDGFRPRVGREE